MTRRGPGRLVVGLALLVQGCAGLITGQDSAEVPAPAIPAPRSVAPGGSVQVEKGRPGLVIAAPHGTSDAATDVLGRALAKLTGFGLVVATGYANLDGEGRRYNVNRPTESVPGAAARLEVWVESQDPVLYNASAAKQSGILAQTPLALHIELPRVARTTHREAYTTVLADFLIQSAALLLPPPR